MEIHIGDILFEFYKVEEGPFQGEHTSKIWKVYHTRLNRYMALREPREDYLADEESLEIYRHRYKRWFECGLSPYIINCYRIVEDDGVPYIISEWNDDDSLCTLIRDESIYSGPEEKVKQRLASYAFQMILAISPFNNCNVWRMEITAKNFVVSEDGFVRLTCFGNEGPDEDAYLSYYISEDEYRGNNPAKGICESNKISELYAWAVIVLEMYCGEETVKQGYITPEKVPQIIYNARVEMPEGLEEIVVQCLDTNSEKRPQVDDVKIRLQEIFKDMLEDDIAFCRVGAEFSADLAVYLNNEALRYDETGDSVWAGRCFDEARERDPNNPLFAYNNCVFEWKTGCRNDLLVRRKYSLSHRLELTGDMNNEIRRCSRARVIIRQMIYVDDSAGYDELPLCPEIDYVCFSKDSTKLMIASKQGNYIRISPAGKGDTLVDIPYNGELPDEYKDIFCEPITRYNGLYLTADESDRKIAFCELRAENSPRIIASIHCNYSAILADYEHRFSFSPDGKMFAVPEEHNNGILIFTCPENDIPRFKYAEFEHPLKLLEKKRKFNELKAICVECMETKAYKKAVELVNEISALGINRKECIYMKHLLTPVCKPTIYIPALRYEKYNGASQVAMTYDGKYFAYRSNSSFGDDEYISIGYIGEKVSVPTSVGECKSQECFSEFDDIREFWFDGENNFCYTHTERVYDHVEDAKAYYSQIDFKNGIKKTDLLYTFTGDCVGNDSMERLKYDNTRIKVVNPELYKETKYASEGSRVRIPMILQHYCRMCKFPVCAIDANRTTMVAGDRSYIRVYDLEITLEYDEEREKEYQGTIVCDYKNAISDSIHLLDKVPIKSVDDSSSQTDTEGAVSELSDDSLVEEKSKGDDKFMKDNQEMFVDYSKCDIYGIGDRNRFLLEMSGYTAFRSLSLLNEVKTINPASLFQNWASQAREWVQKEPQKPHPDSNVQRLIAVSDAEYNDMLLEVARQSKFWHDKPELSMLKVFLNTLKEGKDEVVHVPAEISDLSGFDEFNSFLIEDNPAQAVDFLILEKTQLVNPLPQFFGLINEAKEWIDLGNTTAHDDPDVQHLIECTDEEYENIVKETIRRSAFWHGLPSASFLSIFVRTQSKVELSRAEREMEEKYTDKIFYKIKHPSASKDRLQKVPNLIRSIRDLRTELLDRVIGQDNIVHSFCEAIFNAEVLKESDKERVRPLAAFTFAGPPGVGKTYLAEQAAKLLGRPYKRFDMTEYSTHDTHTGLIGFEYTWKDAAPGMLTSYVYNNPNAILLFDEIEKAHAQVIQIFYQILDAGIVTDKYYSTKSESDTGSEESEKRSRVSFRDTIIIFTTNAGRSLYEGESADNLSSISTKTLLNALSTEINPATKSTFFPSAIVSRIATGYPLMFNHLKPHHLVWIIKKEFARIQSLFKSQYGISIKADTETLLSILYSEGGASDARGLRARTELFFKNEFFKLASSDELLTDDVRLLEFKANTEKLSDEVERLFKMSTVPEILVYSDEKTVSECKKNLNGVVIHTARNTDEAIEKAGNIDLSVVLIDVTLDDDWEGKTMFRTLHTRLPELPIYLFETTKTLSVDLTASFCRIGARGKITVQDGYDELGITLSEICSQLYMQSVASDLAAEHKVLLFDTSPVNNGNIINVELRNYELKQAPDADDIDDLLSDREKPKERFSDVIGAKAAKDELKYFISYLKNPKKFAAQGQRIPKGVLLYGKPGTGKTMLAKAMAGESDATFISTTASSFASPVHGGGSKQIKELFKKARRYAPSIIFIDEVDAIAKQRTGNAVAQEMENTLNALLTEMDGFSTNTHRPVFVLAATNYGVDDSSGIGVLDEAFMRRFDRKIKIELPDTSERKQFLELMLAKVKNHKVTESMIDTIASRSVGISPAILDNIIETAKRMAFDQNTPLDDLLLEEAYEITKRGEKKEWGKEYVQRVARHECGHAIISILGGEIPAYLTIEARGSSGGYMEYPEQSQIAPIRTKDEIIWNIRTALGGRAAEIVCYGENGGLSTGASKDLESATISAWSMLTCFGMDKEFGLATSLPQMESNSPEIREKINEILAEELAATIDLITQNREEFDLLCNKLLEKNRLTGEEIEEIFVKQTEKTGG